MINWNDVQVEMEIAQERYRPLIQARQLERSQATGQSRLVQRWRSGLGQQLVKWGLHLQQQPVSISDTGFQGC